MLINFLPASWKRRRKRRGGGLKVVRRERSVVVMIIVVLVITKLLVIVVFFVESRAERKVGRCDDYTGFGAHWFGCSGFGDYGAFGD